jgi:hypothetical protein
MIEGLKELEVRRKRYWLVDNTGVLARISRETGMSKAFVRNIFWGARSKKTRKGRRIAKLLTDAGAPGFKREVLVETTEHVA